MIDLADEDIKTIFYMFKKLEKRLNMLNRDMESIEKIQIELLGMKVM